jgi:hypothetical protein
MLVANQTPIASMTDPHFFTSCFDYSNREASLGERALYYISSLMASTDSEFYFVPKRVPKKLLALKFSSKIDLDL